MKTSDTNNIRYVYMLLKFYQSKCHVKTSILMTTFKQSAWGDQRQALVKTTLGAKKQEGISLQKNWKQGESTSIDPPILICLSALIITLGILIQKGYFNICSESNWHFYL